MIGIDNVLILTFLIVGFAILLVVILFLSYYNYLLSIIHFAYPNARFKALGTPFIRKHEIDYMMDATSIGEVTSHMQLWGYELPAHGPYDELERELEASALRMIKSSVDGLPLDAKPFFEAYNRSFELRQLKNALRLVNSGDAQNIRKTVTPVGSVTDELLDAIQTSSDIDDAISKLKGTEYGPAIEKLGEGPSLSQVENALEREMFAGMKHSVSLTNTMVAAPLRRFLGVYIDITNLKYVIRGKQEGLEPKELEALMVGEGREFPEWRLKQLAEAKDIGEVLKDLEASPYGADLKGAAVGGFAPALVEYSLDRALLNTTNELATANTLTVGPAVKYFAAKEFEIRNLKILMQRITESVSQKTAEPLLMVEA